MILDIFSFLDYIKNIIEPKQITQKAYLEFKNNYGKELKTKDSYLMNVRFDKTKA